MSTEDLLIKLSKEYEELTGRPAYLYTSRPGDGQTRIVFGDNTVWKSYKSAVKHVNEMLEEAKLKKSHGISRVVRARDMPRD